MYVFVSNVFSCPRRRRARIMCVLCASVLSWLRSTDVIIASVVFVSRFAPVSSIRGVSIRKKKTRAKQRRFSHWYVITGYLNVIHEYSQTIRRKRAQYNRTYSVRFIRAVETVRYSTNTNLTYAALRAVHCFAFHYTRTN